MNYLVPVNVVLNNSEDISKQCFNINILFEKLNNIPNNFVNIVILDCCRNNPSPTNSNFFAQKGFCTITNAVRGTLILCATEPGKFAQKGEANGNGVFTKHLLLALQNKTLKLDDFHKTISSSMSTDPINLTNTIDPINPSQQTSTVNSAGLLDISIHN